jgi:hypothetical protein
MRQGATPSIYETHRRTHRSSRGYQSTNGEGGNGTIYADNGRQDWIVCGPGNKDVVTFDQFDLFYPDSLGEPTNVPSSDCEKPSYLPAG